MHTFFQTTWPRYVAAKQTLVTCLTGRDGAVDALLGQLRTGLTEQGVLVERVLALTAPGPAEQWAIHARELAAVTTTLGRHFDEQLGQEERVLHPALAHHLSASELSELTVAFT